jgi:hypothetical protein
MTALDTLLTQLIEALDLIIRSLDDAVAGIEDIKQALTVYQTNEPFPPDPEPPVENGLKLTAESRPGEVRLSWTAPAQASLAYEVRRATQSGGPYEALACQPFARAVTRARTWIDPDVSNGTTYYYSVRQIAQDGTSGPDSAEAKASPTWGTWTERGSGVDLNRLISGTPDGGTLTLPDGIYRVQSDSDFVTFSKPLTIKATNPGRTWITASRNWATTGEAGNTWSGSGPWTSSLSVPAHGADEDAYRSADRNPFLATTYEGVVGYDARGKATDFVRVSDGSTPGAGQWCWPSSGNRHLKIGTSPGSFERIEVTSGSRRIAQCRADNVTLEGLSFLHAGGGTRNSAVGNDDRNNWTMRDCTIGFSHSGGPRCGDANGQAQVTLQRNYIHHCVHIGISSDNLGGILVEANRLDWTGYNWYDTMWEGGCTKFTRNYAGEGNYVYRYNEAGRGTQGFGLWFDERGDKPQCYANRWSAVCNAYHFEISDGGMVEDNCFASPANGWTGWPTEYISTSSNHASRRNLVVSWISRGLQMYGDDTRNHAYTGNSSTDDVTVSLGPGNGQQQAVFHNKSNMGMLAGTRLHFRNAPFLAVVGNSTVTDVNQFNAQSSADGAVLLDAAAADAALRSWGVI